jgi:hypothetical protein
MLDLAEIKAHAGMARMDLHLCARLQLSLEWALVTVAQLVDELERTRNTLADARVAGGKTIGLVGHDSGK